MSPAKPKAKSTKSRTTKAKPGGAYDYLFDTLLVSTEIQRQVADIAAQVHDKNGKLTATDEAQLSELATTSQRQADLLAMARSAQAECDTNTYMRLTRLIDGLVVIKRGLLSDLRVTRRSVVGAQESAKTKKAASKSGAGWEGLL